MQTTSWMQGSGTKGEPVKKLASLMVNTTAWPTKHPVWDAEKQQFDTLRVAEAERAMGWPVGRTSTGEWQDRVPKEERPNMVGNDFNVSTVAAMLARGRKEVKEAALMNTKGGQKNEADDFG